MKNPNPLEKDIEKRVCDYAKSLGMLVYKFTSPSRRSVPDRMFITKTGVVFFIEFKRKGEKPTAAQEVEIGKILDTGVQVNVVDAVEQGKHIIKTMNIGKGAFVYDIPKDAPTEPSKLTHADRMRIALNDVVDSCQPTDAFSAIALLKAKMVLEEDPLADY